MLKKLIEKFKESCQKIQPKSQSKPPSQPQPALVALIEQVETYVMKTESYVYKHSLLSLKECVAYEQLKNLPAQDKVDALLYMAARANSLQKNKKFKNNLPETKHYYVITNLLSMLLRTKFIFPDDFSFKQVFDIFYAEQPKRSNDNLLNSRPFTGLVSQIGKQVKKVGMSESLQADIEYILASQQVQAYIKDPADHSGWGPDIGKALKKLQLLLPVNEENAQFVHYTLGDGKCGAVIKADVAAMEADLQLKWHKIFYHLSTATAGKPSKIFLNKANPLLEDIGIAEFKQHVNGWFNTIAAFPVDVQTKTYAGGYRYEHYEYIEAYSNNLLKGLLWSMSRFHDQHSLQSIAGLTEKCFQKIPGIGPAAVAVGNAGLFTLAQSKGLGGISHLSRLKLRIRQHNTQKLIQKYIEEQAKKQGIKAAQIEEIAVTDFGLTNGQCIEHFDDYQLMVKLTGVGTTDMQWIKPDGKRQKTVPAFVKQKSKLVDKLKKMRDLVKHIKQASTTQRDRIDRLYTEDMHWDYGYFEKYYLHHGLVSQVANKLIWVIDTKPAFYKEGQWQDEQGEGLSFTANSQVHLWHPIESSANVVLAWRDRLEVLSIQQPFKQAFREIYLLTDAEINTCVYSNRMAAHIIKQHQFNSLAALRGWKYSLLGAYDDGRDGEMAQKVLPDGKLTAQFWINVILDDSDSVNDSGIWNYVATDQVRFCDSTGEPVPLIDIPALVLSEVMRDVDLFVGVASVANDPQWQDGGPEGRQDYRDYWHSYSFGDLREVAKTRKTVLARLLPRLKIRDVAVIEGKFLIVQGKLHQYKIHIGSGNILIAPNDRYLCIVPGRGKDKNLNQVFLPFEGDNGLSIVLSKAFLLVEDDKITDPTIVSQL